jgi:hypothetical protein
MSDIIREFPREISPGPWPLLEPTPEDKQYKPRSETEAHRRWRLRQEARSLLVVDTFEALLKGAILGGIVFTIIFGVVLNLPFWLTGWHWAFGIAGAALLAFLIGFRHAVLVISFGVAIVTALEIVGHPALLLFLLLFIGAGTITRGLIEVFPLGTA